MLFLNTSVDFTKVSVGNTVSFWSLKNDGFDFLISIENHYYANYADIGTPYVIDNNPQEVISKLRDIFEKLFTYFAPNKMKTNFGECRMVLSSSESLDL